MYHVQDSSMATTTLTSIILLLAGSIQAVVLKGTPQLLPIINDKLRYWTDSAQFMPDGKISAFRQNRSDPNSKFIFNIEHNYRLISPTNNLNDVTAPAPAPPSPNFVTIPNTVPIPPANVTGGRGNGTYLDWSSIWINNMFRLCETSQPDAPDTALIGFVHNEDYWGYNWAVNGKTYKSVGVRYSPDLGVSWTRSVPILTKLVQPEFDNYTMSPGPGTGDMAAMWNPINKTWHIFAQEGDFRPYQNPSLVMSVSSDPLAGPGTWTRINPASGKTSPGFIGDNFTLNHPDLSSIKGSNPSIIHDTKNKVWHMCWGQWGGGIAYSNSTDLWRWQTPVFLPLNSSQHPGSTYPTMIGNQGDTLTTDGTATLYFKDDSKTNLWGRSLWAVGLDFNQHTPLSYEVATEEEAEEGEGGNKSDVLGLEEEERILYEEL